METFPIWNYSIFKSEIQLYSKELIAFFNIFSSFEMSIRFIHAYNT